MATRTMRRSVLKAVPKRVEQVQTEAEKVIARGYKAALGRLPVGSRKAVKEFTGQVEEATEELSRRGKRMLTMAEKRGKTLWGRFDKALTVLERRGNRAVKAAGKSVAAVQVSLEKSVSRLERRAIAALRPMVRRLDIATHSDIEKLSKRVAQLERRLARRTKLAA